MKYVRIAAGICLGFIIPELFKPIENKQIVVPMYCAILLIYIYITFPSKD